jgi:hypothetical protein
MLIYQLDRAVSTAGVNPKPQRLSTLVAKGFEIFCAFDSLVKRLPPEKHDWNEV